MSIHSSFSPDARPWRYFSIAILLTFHLGAAAEDRFESFDRDPGWDSLRNRSAAGSRVIRQDSALPDNFVGIAIEGPSREGFFVAPAYSISASHRAVLADPRVPRIYPDGRSHAWRFEWQPQKADAPCRFTVALDRQECSMELPEPLRDAVALNRFGIVTTWIDGNGQRAYLDDLRYTSGQAE